MQRLQRAGRRFQPGALGVGEAQPIAQPLGVLANDDGERGEPQQRVVRDRRQPRQPRRAQHAAEQRRQQAGRVGLGNDGGAVPGDEDFQQFRAHALGRERRQPCPLGDRGGEAVGVEPAFAEPRREAQEPQDAQVILADALARRADEPHPAEGEIGEAADFVVDEALAHRPTTR